MKKSNSLLPLTILLACTIYACSKPGNGGQGHAPTVTPPKVTPESPKKKEDPKTHKISVVLPSPEIPGTTRDAIIEGSSPAMFFGVRQTGTNVTIDDPKEYTLKLVSDTPVEGDVTFTVSELPNLDKLITPTYSRYGLLSLGNVDLPAKIVMPKGGRETDFKIGLKDVGSLITQNKNKKGFVIALELKSSDKNSQFDEKRNLIGIVAGVTVEEKGETKKEGDTTPQPKTPEKKPEGPKAPEKKPDTPKAPEKKPDSPKAPEKKPDSPKAPEKKPEGPKAPEKKPDSPKAPEKKPEGPKAPEKKPDSPKTPEKKPDTPKAPEKKPDTPKAPEKKPDTPKAPEKKPDTPKAPEKKPDTPKAPEAKPGQPKTPDVKPKPSPGNPGTPAPSPGRPAPITPPSVSPKEQIVVSLSMPATAKGILQSKPYDLSFDVENGRLTREYPYYVTIQLNKPAQKPVTIKISEYKDADALQETFYPLPFSVVGVPGAITFNPGNTSTSIGITLNIEDNPLLFNPYYTERLISMLKFSCDDPDVIFQDGQNAIGIVLNYKSGYPAGFFTVHSGNTAEQKSKSLTRTEAFWEVYNPDVNNKNSQRDGKDEKGKWKNNPEKMFDKDDNTFWWVDSNSKTYLEFDFHTNKTKRPAKIKGIYLKQQKALSSANIQVSANGRDWINLGEVESNGDETIFVEFKHPTTISKLRIGSFVTKDSRGPFVDIRELAFYK